MSSRPMENRVALVTGASMGIGLETAMHLVRNKINKFLVIP